MIKQYLALFPFFILTACFDSGLSQMAVDGAVDTSLVAISNATDAAPTCSAAPAIEMPSLGFEDPLPVHGATMVVRSVASARLELSAVGSTDVTAVFRWVGPALPFAIDQEVTIVRPTGPAWLGIEAPGGAALVWTHQGPEVSIPFTPAAPVEAWVWRWRDCSIDHQEASACGAATQTLESNVVGLAQLDQSEPAQTGETSGPVFSWRLTNVVSTLVGGYSNGGCVVAPMLIEALTIVR